MILLFLLFLKEKELAALVGFLQNQVWAKVSIFQNAN
jgi:hypothetical protein